MATYSEILDIASNTTGDALRKRVRVAVIVAADIVRGELVTVPNHANRMAWAKTVLQNPDQEATRMLWAVLAQNRAATQAQIVAADDATVQGAVNLAIDLLAGV